MSDAHKTIKTAPKLRAIRLAREQLGITRHQLARQLGITYKAVEKIENGRTHLSKEREREILNFLGIDLNRFEIIKKHGVVIPMKRSKKVMSNSQRRSYRRVITKEVRVLRILRQLKKLNQYQASKLCGYSKPTIGHIENGRIELPLERISHIVKSYGQTIDKFHELMNENILRDEIIKQCTDKINNLPESKLQLIQTMLENL